MPRNISFAFTTSQIKARTKTVTRRLGWGFLKAGVDLWAVEKAMGLRKGEKVKRITLIHIVNVRADRLSAITQEDCVLEGFPDLTPAEIVKMFCQHNNCAPDVMVNRIEFEYL